MVEAHGKMMVVGDVPVNTTQDLQVVLIGTPIAIATRVVAVFLLQESAQSVQVALLGTRNVFVCIHLAVVRWSPAVGNSRNERVLGVGEEEQLVLDNRSTEGKSVSGVAVCAALSKVGVGHTVSVHVLIIII